WRVFGVASIVGGPDLNAGRAQDLVRRVPKDQVAAVVGDGVAAQGCLRRHHVEGTLRGPEQDALHPVSPPLQLLVTAGRAVPTAPTGRAMRRPGTPTRPTGR